VKQPVVLLVEDEELVREVLCEELGERGLRVIEASDGAGALEALRREAVDLLLTDIRLPGEPDGWGIAEFSRERAGGLPVIYMTGYATGHERAVPGSIVLKKPFLPEDLIAAIGALGVAISSKASGRL
jgi:CheY-like chemotaxis protein